MLWDFQFNYSWNFRVRRLFKTAVKAKFTFLQMKKRPYAEGFFEYKITLNYLKVCFGFLSFKLILEAYLN